MQTGTEWIQNGCKNVNGTSTEQILNGNGTNTEYKCSNGQKMKKSESFVFIFVFCSHFFIVGVESAWLLFLRQSHRLLVTLYHFGKDSLIGSEVS